MSSSKKIPLKKKRKLICHRGSTSLESASPAWCATGVSSGCGVLSVIPTCIDQIKVAIRAQHRARHEHSKIVEHDVLRIVVLRHTQSVDC
jgi:integral membrane sensor domain MASE1